MAGDVRVGAVGDKLFDLVGYGHAVESRDCLYCRSLRTFRGKDEWNTNSHGNTEGAGAKSYRDRLAKIDIGTLRI